METLLPSVWRHESAECDPQLSLALCELLLYTYLTIHKLTTYFFKTSFQCVRALNTRFLKAALIMVSFVLSLRVH